MIYVGHSQGTIQFWISNILYDDLGSKVRAAAAIGPVMFVGNQSSIFVNLAVQLGIDKLLTNYFESVLWFKKGYSLISDVAIEAALRFI